MHPIGSTRVTHLCRGNRGDSCRKRVSSWIVDLPSRLARTNRFPRFWHWIDAIQARFKPLGDSTIDSDFLSSASTWIMRFESWIAWFRLPWSEWQSDRKLRIRKEEEFFIFCTWNAENMIILQTFQVPLINFCKWNSFTLPLWLVNYAIWNQ